MQVTRSLLPPENECQRRIYDFWASILHNQTAMQRHRPIIVLSAAFRGKNASDDIATALSLYVIVFNFTNMHAMSQSSDFYLAFMSKVKIQEPAFYLTRTYPVTVTQIELPRIQYPTAMSDTKCQNTLLLEVMISSKNECILIRDLTNLALQIIFNALWASMNVGSKRPIAWDNSRHAPLWRFYLHCGIEETGTPAIVCIVSHQVLRHPSEHGASSMGKHWMAKAHIAKSNKLTVSEVTESTSSTIDETALAILKRQGSRGIPILSSQRKFKFTI